VAVEVKVAAKPEVSRPERTDILFADGRPEGVRTAGAAKMSGRFAMFSRDAAGLRQATLVGGSTLSAPDVTITLPRREYAASILEVDYLKRTATLDVEMPKQLLSGSYFEVGNEQHKTSVAVDRIEGKTVHFRKGVELVTTRVIRVDEEAGTITCRLGIPPAGGKLPGMDAGLTATNEDRSKVFRCEFLGGTSQDGYQYRLTGAKVTKQDFPELGTLRVFEFGPGDTLTQTTWASLRRPDGNVYELSANSAVTIGLNGGGLEISPDGKTWESAKTEVRDAKVTAKLTGPDLGSGRVYLRTR